MILLFGYGDDSALRRVADEAAARGLPHLFVDQRLPEPYDLSLQLESDERAAELSAHGMRWNLADVTGVYARPLIPVPQRDPRLQLRSVALSEMFGEWLEVADARVVSRPSAMHSNSSKPFQSQIIARHGFFVPVTLITSDPDEATEFWRAHGDVVFKSISGIRSIVRRLDEARARDLHRIRSLPTQFQVYVPGSDVRVHVVGTRVFATAVSSGAVDYRYANQDGLEATLSAFDLPDEVSSRCVALAADLGLPLCGLDLRRRPDGAYVCFEVNPMPAYSYYESHTGQPISSALVDHLCGYN